MPRKRVPKSYIRSVGRIGSDKNHSYYVTLPMAFVRGLGWHEGQKITVKRVGSKLHLIDRQT